jgi:hypothetical protein
VLSLALDLAGQDTPPFSPGLLPGACCCWVLPALRGGRDRAGRPGRACGGMACTAPGSQASARVAAWWQW